MRASDIALEEPKVTPTSRTTILCFVVLFTAFGAIAAVNAVDRTHVLISKTSGLGAPTDSSLFDSADFVAQYDSYTLVRFPKTARNTLLARASQLGLIVEERDDFSLLTLPGATIDVRNFALSSFVNVASPTYAESGGLYVIQLAGPPVPSWIEALRSAGAKLVHVVNQNGYIVAATSASFAQIRAFPFVQFADLYYPFEKRVEAAATTGGLQCIVEVADMPDRGRVVDEIRRFDSAMRVETYATDFLVHATLPADEIRTLSADPIVIGIHREPHFQPSDERQALGATPNITSGGGAPTNPKGYASWLASACSGCTSLNLNGFRVGTADTGLDAGGMASRTHADLNGREYFGTIFASPNDAECSGTPGYAPCDAMGHGTLVAGVIAGSAASGAADTSGYYLGTGIAPSAGVFSTKIFSRTGAITGSIYNWAHDARTNSVYIQNHSHNDYGATCPNGQYTLSSRQYDYAVRDSNVSWSDGVTPITLTVSAGNIDQCPVDVNRPMTLPPATAKNVISVGAAENYRPDRDYKNCHNTLGDDFRNLSQNSKRGTTLPGYFKPDLIAPATYIVSTRSGSTGDDFCEKFYDGNTAYSMESGTSFAAPAAAASALLASRFYSSTPGAASPALVKAMLIADARSVLGGTDRLTGIGLTARPNTQAGFGLLNLSTVLSTVRRYAFDQAYTFTSSGQTWTKTLYPDIPSSPVVIALVWSDAPAQAGAAAPLVNNLDITALQNTSSGCLYKFAGNKINSSTEYSTAYTCNQSNYTPDSVNNVEIIRFIPNFITTSITVTVRATSVTSQGVPLGPALSQDFAIYALNAHQ